MTFASPIRLLLLAAPLGLLASYFWMQRHRKTVAVRFTSVDLLASVAPKRPGWQRHVAPALLFVTLLALVVGFANPQLRVRTPRQQATVVLAMDVSGSMIATDVAPNRLTAAKAAAATFADALPSGVKLGLVSFSTTARVVVTPTTDRAIVRNAIATLRAEGGTATGDAIVVSLQAAKSVVLDDASSDADVPATIVLMSDGKPTRADGAASAMQAVDDAIAVAKADGVTINTIAFGTDTGTVTVNGESIPVPSDPAAMAAIASDTGGKTFTAESASQLESVYDDIGRIVGYVTEQKTVTAAFTGAGLLLAAAAAAAALRFGHRIA